MIHSFTKLLDYIFPPTAHELVLRTYSKDTFISLLQPGIITNIHYLSSYHTPAIQAAIAATKFEHSYLAAKLLQHLVEKWLHTLPPKPTILIPIPLSAKRERKRGYNQVTRVIAPIRDLPYPSLVLPLLTRTRDTTAQTSLKRKDRLTNMQSAFTVQTRYLKSIGVDTRIIICDDVITTGATLAAARAALVSHLSPTTEIICVAWAH